MNSDSAWTKWAFAAWVTLACIAFISPFVALVRLCLTLDDMSHLLVIPVFAVVLLFLARHATFRTTSRDWAFCPMFTLFGLFLVAGTFLVRSIPADVQLSLRILAFLLFCAGGFAFCFGRAALRAAHFPLLYLLLMVPPPEFLLRRIVYLLQAGSADITDAIFNLLRTPALREGFVFHLPQFSIAVEKECSGIRSSIAILILALPFAHFAFRRFWKKAAFVASAMVVMIVKNGIRIATLTLLAMYVDPGFLFGRLHHQGGVVFFLVGLALLVPVYFALKVGETPEPTSNAPSQIDTGGAARIPG